MTRTSRKRRIVVLINHDARNCEALEWALTDVRATADELHLLRTFRPLNLPECWWAPVSRTNDDLRLAARTALSRAMSRVRASDVPIQVSASSVPREPEDALVTLSRVADEIVVGAADLRVPQLRTLVRSVQCPLVVVPNRAEPPAGPVALELDRPELPAAATAFAFAAAQRHRCELAVTLSWGLGLPGEPEVEADEAPWLSAQQEGLAASLASWRAQYPTVPVSLALRHESAYESLHRAGRRASLIVVPRWAGGPLPLSTLALSRQAGPVAVVAEAVPAPRAAPRPVSRAVSPARGRALAGAAT